MQLASGDIRSARAFIDHLALYYFCESYLFVCNLASGQENLNITMCEQFSKKIDLVFFLNFVFEYLNSFFLIVFFHNLPYLKLISLTFYIHAMTLKKGWEHSMLTFMYSK